MTGSRGPISKPANRRQRRNKPTSPLILGEDGKRAKAPKPSKHYLDDTVVKWKAFWASDLAKTMREIQLPMIVRLHDRYDERERALRVIRQDGRLTRGSQGQMVLHPLMKLIDSCEGAIRQDEDRLGISPRRGGAPSGGTAADGSLDDVNRRLNGDHEEPDAGDEEETDPRAKHVVGEIRGS